MVFRVMVLFPVSKRWKGEGRNISIALSLIIHFTCLY